MRGRTAFFEELRALVPKEKREELTKFERRWFADYTYAMVMREPFNRDTGLRAEAHHVAIRKVAEAIAKDCVETVEGEEYEFDRLYELTKIRAFGVAIRREPRCF